MGRALGKFTEAKIVMWLLGFMAFSLFFYPWNGLWSKLSYEFVPMVTPLRFIAILMVYLVFQMYYNWGLIRHYY